MFKPLQFLRVGLTLVFILTACAAPTPAPTIIPPKSQPTPQPTLTPATLVPTPESIDVGMPAIDYKDGRNELILISSVTGKVFEAFKPILLGENSYTYAFASDRRTLALVSDGQLYLIDLPSWKYRSFDVGLHGWLSSVIYSLDESLLVLVGGGPEGDLQVVDAKNGEVKAKIQAGFSIRNVKVTTDGKALMVYGPHLSPNNSISIGAPKAAVFALPDLSMLWSVDLKGIRDGVFPKKADTPDIYQPGAAWFFAPGVAFSPDGDILYLVHGDADKLTTVDFAHRRVRTVAIHVEASWFDQLLALTAGVAHAKGMDGTVKQAVISLDGKSLYVVGSTEVVTQSTNSGNWDVTDTPIGLQVIATEDGTLVDKRNADATSLQLSLNGKQIFMTGWKKQISYETPWTDIYDMSSQKLVKHIDNVYLTPTRLLNGKPILVSSYGVSDNLCYMAFVDSRSWTITNEWKGTNCFGWLIDP